MPKTKILGLLAPAALAAALGGCSMDLSGFSVAELNPLKGNDPLRSEEYNYFYRRDQKSTGVVTAADLIGPDGRCAFDAAPTYAPPGPAAPDSVAQTPPADPINPRSNQALYFTTGPESGAAAGAAPALPPQVRSGPSGIALQMTECEVVRVAGYTDRVEIGANERGQRSVTLSYMSGPRPGIYRFLAGRLASMERVAEPPQPKKPQKPAKTAKKSAPRQ
ncbi:MAG: hypothetical protein E6G97_06425 [Alphaproteobacteria bacterium]|nr:MAG: hypothetical protein E6G97_06425 [Alphaproteobacteria bacterium]